MQAKEAYVLIEISIVLNEKKKITLNTEFMIGIQ